MTNLEMSKLPTGTRVRIKKSVLDAADCYKSPGLLSWYNSKKQGYTEIDTDSGEMVISYPFGIELISGGVCYLFPAECYELV